MTTKSNFIYWSILYLPHPLTREIIGKNKNVKYEPADELLDDSTEDSQYYYEDEGGEEEEYEEDLEGYEVSYHNPSKSPSQYYNGRPTLDLEGEGDSGVGGGDLPNGKKRKRVFVIRKGNWTQEEDHMISQIVTQEGPKNWSKVINFNLILLASSNRSSGRI